MISNVLYSSASCEWETPQYVYDTLNKKYNFTCDVCATKENAKCERYYTKEIDGLLQIWEGACRMNPPYGRNIGEWVKKAHDSKCVVVGLLPVRTDTIYFHNYIYGKTKIDFLRGRLKFSNSKNSAPFPSMIVVWDV